MNACQTDYANDSLLIKQVEEGNINSFKALYEKYWQTAYADAYKRLKVQDQAEDIVQDIFTHIWVKRDSLVIDNVPAYLKTAVRNAVFKLVAKQKPLHPFFDLLDNIPATSLQADANLLWQEFSKSAEQLLSSLPPKKQLIFRLRFQEELSTRDISSRLGLSRKTVQNQLTKLVEQLKVSLFYFLVFLFSLPHF
jgi:RNA polymerase sigma-70 factor (ECF subfamily)